MAFNILPLESLVSFEVAKLFWNASFRIDDLQLYDLRQTLEPNWDIKLTEYRKEAIGHLNVFIKNRMLPDVFKTPLTENIFLLQKAYHKFLLWKITYDPDNKINLLQRDELYAPNYFTIDGEFNDVAWAKRFVVFQNSLVERLNMACTFWFENECENLFRELKDLHTISYGNNYDFLNLVGHNSPQIQLWLLLLEKKENDQELTRGFWQVFKRTVQKGYEHAVYRIWQKLPDLVKTSVMGSDLFFEFLCLGTEYPRDNISYFLFSQLSEARKEAFLSWSSEPGMQMYYRNITGTWLSLLFPLYGKAMHFEILKFIYRLPIDKFSDLLQILSHRIMKYNLILDAKIFQVVWSKLTSESKNDVLERGIYIIENLVQAKSLYNLGFIIKGLSFEQKERCLIHGLYGACIYSLEILKNEREFDFLQKYLSYFLFDMDSCTQTQTMNRDAISLLQTFIHSSAFIRWCNGSVLENLVKDRIDNLLTSATLVHELCEKVCEEVSILQNPSTASDLKTHYPEKTELALPSSSSQKRKFDEKSTPVKCKKL